MKQRRHWFVRTTDLISPTGNMLTIVTRFDRVVAAYLDGKHMSPSEFAFYARSCGVDLEAQP